MINFLKYVAAFVVLVLGTIGIYILFIGLMELRLQFPIIKIIWVVILSIFGIGLICGSVIKVKKVFIDMGEIK